MQILPNARNIEDILARTRILLMPSLWYEGFGLIVMEAMLRGIPVVSSDAGGLKEAKRGTGYVIPVRTIEKYQPVFDEHAMPKPVVPPNDVGPWVEAIEELLGEPGGVRAGIGGVEGSGGAVRGRAGCGGPGAVSARAEAGGGRTADRVTIESLSPEKRALLLRDCTPKAGGGRHRGLDARPGPGRAGEAGASRSRMRADRSGMRILLAQNSLYYPAHGGGDKSNRLLVEALAARGHECRVVARIPVFGEAEQAQYLGSCGLGGRSRASRMGWCGSGARVWTSMW